MLRIEPAGTENVIGYPIVHSEFEVHAELFSEIATRQGQRYVTFGVPVLVCYGFDDIKQVVDEVKSIFEE